MSRTSRIEKALATIIAQTDAVAPAGYRDRYPSGLPIDDEPLRERRMGFMSEVMAGNARRGTAVLFHPKKDDE